MSKTTVLITGANTGLGFEVVKKLSAENEDYRILLCARDVEKGQRAASEISTFAKGTSVEVIQLDVTDDTSIANAAKEVETKYGHLDILFNNAGVARVSGATIRERMHQVYDVNVAGVVAVIDTFLPLLKKSDKAARIVIMSSDVGSIAGTLDPNFGSYFYKGVEYKASKAAVNMVGAVYSQILLDDKIRVNLVNPGLRSTAFNNYTTHPNARPKEGGAVEACRLITMGDDGGTGTFTETEGPIAW